MIRITFHLQVIASSLCARFLAITLALLCAQPSWSAAIEQREFADAAQRELYYEMIKELRCLVCQNQNLAESDADLAKDLRNKTYDLINQGEDRQSIVDYMVTRYGDFVLYRPPFKLSTAVLWLGPLFLLAIGSVILWRVARRRNDKLTTANDGGANIETARHLLNNTNSDADISLATTPSRASER